MKNISERFREYRSRAGVTQPELAALLRVGSNYVYQIEAGRKNPGGSLLRLFEQLEAGEMACEQVMPPHAELSPPSRLQEAAPLYYTAPTTADFTECVQILSTLFATNPQAFRSAAAMIKGLHEEEKRK